MSKNTPCEIAAIADLATQKQMIHLKGIPSRYRGIFKAAYVGRSLRKAVSAFCLDCVGLDPDEVRKCSAPTCPLWSVRPYQTSPVRRQA